MFIFLKFSFKLSGQRVKGHFQSQLKQAIRYARLKQATSLHTQATPEVHTDTSLYWTKSALSCLWRLDAPLAGQMLGPSGIH